MIFRNGFRKKREKQMAIYVDRNDRFQELREKFGIDRKEKKGKGTRKKGLDYVREARDILRSEGHQTEGPGYTILRIYPKETRGLPPEERKKIKLEPVQVHRDYFTAFDLISFRPDIGFIFHQVSILEEKSRKIKIIQDQQMKGWVWGRFEENERIGFRIFEVDLNGEVKERETVWLKDYRKEKHGTDNN
jgi:hypothetical protein